jgi:hypothetical protein
MTRGRSITMGFAGVALPKTVRAEAQAAALHRSMLVTSGIAGGSEPITIRPRDDIRHRQARARRPQNNVGK